MLWQEGSACRGAGGPEARMKRYRGTQSGSMNGRGLGAQVERYREPDRVNEWPPGLRGVARTSRTRKNRKSVSHSAAPLDSKTRIAEDFRWRGLGPNHADYFPPPPRRRRVASLVADRAGMLSVLGALATILVFDVSADNRVAHAKRTMHAAAAGVGCRGFVVCRPSRPWHNLQPHLPPLCNPICRLQIEFLRASASSNYGTDCG